MFKKKILTLLAALFLLSGCSIRELWDDCAYWIRINFAFTNNPTGENTLAASIQDIRVYVYDDATGILLAVYRATPEEIDQGYMMIYLPAGVYDIVSWASSNPDMFQSGVEEGQTPPAPPPPPDPPNPDDPTPQPEPEPEPLPVVPGETTHDNTQMGLDTNPGPGTDNTPTNDQFGDLFHDSSEDELSRPGRDLPDDDVEMDFSRVSSMVNLQISGMDHLPAGVSRPPHVFITGRNGTLNANGDVMPDAPSVRYEPYSQESDSTDMEARFQTMKIQANMETTQPLMLNIQDRPTGRDIVRPLNLITLIRNVRNPDGSFRYRTQEDIDREIEFRIQLDFTPEGGMRVTINDFIVETLIPILFTWN
jgi:hypothetical protein